MFSSANFTQEQSEALVNFLNQQSIAQAQLLGKDDFQQAISTKADKDDIKALIQQLDKKADKDDVQALIQQMDKKSDEHRADIQALTIRMDSFMKWSFACMVTCSGIIIAVIKLLLPSS